MSAITKTTTIQIDTELERLGDGNEASWVASAHSASTSHGCLTQAPTEIEAHKKAVAAVLRDMADDIESGATLLRLEYAKDQS